MPLYEYECSACGHRFELIQRFADPPAETCIACGKGPVHKLLSAPAVHFKGTGWYVTDYAKKGSSDAGKPDAGSKDEGKPVGETKPAGESKAAGEKKAAALVEKKQESSSKNQE
jgi:putative FmdB family regulatory protein